MKLIFLFFIISINVVFSSEVFSQVSSANYTFANASNGSLTDMSSGTTSLIAGGVTNGISTVQSIGFDFYFMGTRYTQFGVTSNGFLRLGSAIAGGAVVTASNNLNTTSANLLPLIAPFWDAMQTNATGGVRFKVTGSAPNRVLTVEWFNLEIGVASSTANGTFQLRLYETSGRVEFVYGSMAIGAGSAAVTASIGFTIGNSNNNLVSVTSITSPAVTTLSASVVNNLVNSSTAGAITALNSSSDGNRVVYTFTPPVPNPPTSLSFTNVYAHSLKLAWADASNELNYVIYRSDDGGITYNYIATTPANVTSYTSSGLTANTNYMWQVYSLSDGGLSSVLAGTQSTNSTTYSLNGVKTVGASGDFTTIQQVFATIDDISGAAILELKSDYNSALETYPLSFNNLSGISSSNTIVIRPEPGVSGIQITSSVSQTLDFNGAKYITIDGRPGGTGSSQEITISNSIVAGSSVRFINDASNNTIRYCKINGVTTSTTGGVVWQSTTNGTTGNDNNTIDHCEIRDGASVPAMLIYNAGTLGFENDGLTVSNCNMYNFSNSAFQSSVTGTGNGYTFSDNNIYQSSSPPSAVTSATTFRGISIQAGNNHLVTGNNIGGQNINCGGSPYLNTAAVSFTAISLQLDTLAASSVQNNKVQNVNLSSTGSSSFRGISVDNGMANIGTSIMNTIGDNSVSNSVVVAGSSSTYGISLSGNITGSLMNVSNNIIANLVATGTGATVQVYGIISRNKGTINISNNIVHDLSSNSSASSSSPTNVPVCGIVTTSVGSGSVSQQNINNNIVFALRSTTTASFNTCVYGIAIDDNTTGNLYKNKIYDLTNTATGTPKIYGIASYSQHKFIFSNNQIALTNFPNTNPVDIKGFSAPAPSDSGSMVWYNSFYIGGSAASGSLSSSALCNEGANTILNAANNILFNERIGGSGNHCAVYYRFGSQTTSNYNLLIAAESSIANWEEAIYSFADYKLNTTRDEFSYSTQPSVVTSSSLFSDVSTANLNINASNNSAFYADGKGIPISGQSDDFNSDNVRNTSVNQGTTDLGSDEFDYSGTIPNVTVSAPPALNTTTTYSFGGKLLASITWGNSGTVPTGISMTYNSGVNPPGTEGNVEDQYSKAYWDITSTGGSGYTYDIVLNYAPSILFTIVNENNLKIAKRDGVWSYISSATVNTTLKTVTATGLNSFSQFALTSSDAPLPVELSSFSSLTLRNEVVLDWSTVSEINNASFEIERSLSAVVDNYKKIGIVQGSGTTNEIKKYNFHDRNLQSGKYKYRLKQIDFNGNFQYFNLNSEVSVGVPNKYDLSQNYPNPFNPVTKINYELPKDSKVNLKIYDVTGKEVANIINNEVQAAGYYIVTFNAANLSSGIYFYTLISSDFALTKKMMLIK